MNSVYDFINVTKADNKNELNQAVILEKVPVESLFKASEFIIQHFPHLQPSDYPVMQDGETARALAKHTNHELFYLNCVVKDAIEELKGECEQARIRAEKNENQQGLTAYLAYQADLAKFVELSHELVGALMIHEIITKRMFELLRISGEAYPNDWRF